MLIVDAQLSPHLAKWIHDEFNIETYSCSHLGMLKNSDAEIFEFAREKSAIVMTKDFDFIRLQERKGAPPKLIWVTCGNTSTEKMKQLLSNQLTTALRLLENADLVELTD